MVARSANRDGGAKIPAGEIVKMMGYDSVGQFLSKPDPGVLAFQERAFPEFLKDDKLSLVDRYRSSIYWHESQEGLSLERYVAAYDLTYRHHYAMQDEWLAAIADPDIACFTYPRKKPVPADDVAAHPHKYLPFEMFERAMLCVADDDYWAGNVREPWASLDGNVVSTWICRWRRRLDRPVVAGADDHPGFHKAVWRDNWKAVRDEVAEIACQGYPLAESYAIPRESLEGALLALAERLAEQFGLVVRDRSGKAITGREPWEWWSDAAWIVARDIADLPWDDYIKARSGHEWHLSGGDFPLG